jgi:hypothetical protein
VGFCCLWVGVQAGQLAIMGMRVWFSTKARWLTAFDLLILTFGVKYIRFLRVLIRPKVNSAR